MTFTAKDKEISFVDYSEEDYCSFVACFNKFHCGGYAKPEYLAEAYLNEKIKSGNLLLTLGKLSDGRVVSISAAERHTGALEGIVELFMRCVDPEFQGCHVGTTHEKYLLERIESCFPGMTSLQADAVTYDIKSQKTLLKNGFNCCGFYLMMYDCAKTVPILSLPEGTRMSFAIYCKPRNYSPVMIYPPAEHSEKICSIYDRMGVKYSLGTAEKNSSDCFEYEFYKFEEHKTADFCISVPGNNGFEKLGDTLNELLSNGYTVVGSVNMSHPGCVEAYRRLRNLGFYFAGVRPFGKNGQYMIVSQTSNSLCGFDSVKLPESEKTLLDYIIDGGNRK